ncbi:hypothetical protein 276BB001_52 [Bacillus phage 276BB001]|nr:hypothetical protein 276BB001_52 [Bacillus phage 276BB001]QFG06002.1 hypothetical protein 280BB001_52 [Bacillus phage 280BB001]
MPNCKTCKFALDVRTTFHNGEQVKCQKASELFGGERWVNLLDEARCGTYEEFSIESIPEFTPNETDEMCSRCHGSGEQTVMIMMKAQKKTCSLCKGKGVITK